MLAEYDENGTLITLDTRADQLISQERTGEKSYYLYDGFDSVRMLANDDCEITDTYVYDAFGNLTSSTGETENSFLYRGEQFDSFTGLYYLRARYMNPSTGTFITMDECACSIFEPVSLHKYLYANANPVMYSDPSGYSTLAETKTSATGHSILAVGHSIASTAARVRGMAILSSLLAITTRVLVDKLEQAWLELCIDVCSGTASSSAVVAKTVDIVIDDSLPDEIADERRKQDDDNRITLYHYTNKENAQSIASSNIILADDKNRVFLTDNQYSPDEVNNALFMGTKPNGYGDYVVVIFIEVDNPNLVWGFPNATQPNEIVHLGSIRNGRNNVNFYVMENNF